MSKAIELVDLLADESQGNPDDYRLQAAVELRRLAVLEESQVKLLEALQNLIEAAESMKGTYTFVQGKTPEHEDHYGHEKWAEEFLQETTDAAHRSHRKSHKRDEMSKWEELEKAARKAQANGESFGVVIMPDAIIELLAERDALQSENLEHCRLLGISAERELKLVAELDALKAELDRIRAMEPFGTVTVRHSRFEHHADQYQFFPAGLPPYLDTADECHVVYTLEKP